jgi:hypothetical protein
LEYSLALRAVRKEEDRDEVGALVVAFGRRRLGVALERVAADVHGHAERIADRRPAEGRVVAEVVERHADLLVVCRGRRSDLRHPCEDDHPDPQPLGRVVEEEPDRPLRRPDATRPDVPGLHRARDVEHQDDRRAVLRHQPAHVRPRRAPDERRECEQEQDGRHVAPPGASTRHLA